QLATIALAARIPENPLAVLAGTTTGMLIADGIGIIVGVVLCKRIPERTIKLVSAGAFIVFGFIAVYQISASDLALTLPITLGIMGALLVVTAIGAIWLIRKNQTVSEVEAVAEYCRTKNALDMGDGPQGLDVGTRLDA
ncbi:MAG: TMEM165/GDT1 family protein, partial [Eubacteriales bacterium]|nr:TMEM165/GDT1 family protein [Eubacteriales bacterium]